MSDQTTIAALPTVADLERHVTAVESAQTALADLLARKSAAITAHDLSAMQRIAAEEAETVTTLGRLKDDRDRFLAGARAAGHHAGSLFELAARLAMPHPLRLRLGRARETAASLQRQNWTQWVVALRSAKHYQELLQFIAAGGQESPVYGETAGGSGGGLLDAAA